MEENKKELEDAKISEELIGEVDGGLRIPGKNDRELEKFKQTFNESIQEKNDDLDIPSHKYIHHGLF